MTCKTPVIASIAPKCLLHLSNVPGLLTSIELNQMSKLDETSFETVLNPTEQQQQEQPLKHLSQLAQAYKQIFNKLIQDEQQQNQQQQQEHMENISEERQEKLIPTILEEDNTSIMGSEDVFEPASMSGGLVHIKQEILENTHNVNDDHDETEISHHLANDEDTRSDNIQDTINSQKESLKEDGELVSHKLVLPIITSTLESSKLESCNSDEDESNTSDSSSTSSSSSSSTSTTSSNSNSNSSSDTDTTSSSSSNESDTDSSDSDSESSTSSSSENEIKLVSKNQKLDLETIAKTSEANNSFSPVNEESSSSRIDNAPSQSDELSNMNDEKKL
jgi:hypothetical protein